MTGELVVVVDTDDRPLGTMDKLEAHQQPGRLHRAISVFLYDAAGRLLLQRRAPAKYHFGGLWANTACSHPRPDESVLEAGQRRLREEMGIRAVLEPAGSFVYRAEDPSSGLVEHEFDHVLVGVSDEDPRMDLREADAFDRVHPGDLARRLAVDETGFVPWLRHAFEAVPVLEVGP